MEEELVISIMEKNERICRLEERHIEANGELVRARSELKEPEKKHPELWSRGLRVRKRARQSLWCHNIAAVRTKVNIPDSQWGNFITALYGKLRSDIHGDSWSGSGGMIYLAKFLPEEELSYLLDR